MLPELSILENVMLPYMLDHHSSKEALATSLMRIEVETLETTNILACDTPRLLDIDPRHSLHLIVILLHHPLNNTLILSRIERTSTIYEYTTSTQRPPRLGNYLSLACGTLLWR